MQDHVFEDLDSLPVGRRASSFEQCFVDIPSPADAQFSDRGSSDSFDVDSFLQLDNVTCPLWSADSYEFRETPFSDDLESTSLLAGLSQEHLSDKVSPAVHSQDRPAGAEPPAIHAQDHPWLETTEEYLQLVPKLFRSGYRRSEAHLFYTADQREARMFFVPASPTIKWSTFKNTAEDSADRCEAQRKGNSRSGAKVKSKGAKILSFFPDAKEETVKSRRSRHTSGISDRETENEPPRTGPETPPRSASISDVPILSRKRKVSREKEAVQAEEQDLESVLAPTSPNLPPRKGFQVLKPSSATSTRKLSKVLSVKTNSKDAIDEKTEQACVSCKNERPAETRTVEPAAKPKKGGRRNLQKRPHPKESVQVLVAWTQSSSVVAYPDKETKLKLAEAAHLSVQQVESWLAVQRNKTGLIKVPDALRKRSRTRVLQPPRGLQEYLENEE